MARVMRPRRVAAAPTTMDTAMSSANSEPSILPSKRTLPKNSDDKENDGIQAPRKSKRIALADKSNAKAAAWKSTEQPTNTVTKPSSPPVNSSDWDVTGKYRLKCTSRYKPVDASHYSLQIHYQAGPPGQLYATFVFGNLRGIMRMCSASSLVSNVETGVVQPFFLDEFEAACNLPEGCKPGPTCSEWLMRWRGHEFSSLAGGETRAQGQFIFKREGANSSTSPQKIKIVFAIVHKGKHLLFEGVKARSSEPNSMEGWSLEKEWQDRFDPTWEVDVDMESDSSREREPKSPPSGGIIEAKNKPGPNPGSICRPAIHHTASKSVAVIPAASSPTPRPQPLSPYIETPPEWSWNILGQWKITSPAIAKNLKLGKYDTVYMTVRLENNPRHKNIGRQLWAKLDFSQNLEGIMRFSPTCPPGKSLSFFEKSCKLKTGVWIGSSPAGRQKWNVRWRGLDLESGSSVSCSEGSQTEVEFKREVDGQLTMKGSMMCNSIPSIFEGRKVGPGPTFTDTDSTVAEVWASYRPQHLGYHIDPRNEEEELESTSDLNQRTYSNEKSRASSTNWPQALAVSRASSNMDAQLYSNETQSWDIEGHYKITKLETHHSSVDTSDFSLKIFYSKASDNIRQVYAVFKFESLDGMMRICPDTVNQTCSHKEFDKKCNMDSKLQPGPNNTHWLMRWRARDGGMRLGERVGGDPDCSVEFSFEHDVSSSSAKFTAINILFGMVYRDNNFIFHASKTSNLEKECEDSISTLEDKWFDLLNLNWEGAEDYLTVSDSDSDSESESESEPEPESEISASTLLVSPRPSTGLQRLAEAQLSDLPNPASSRSTITRKAPPRPTAKYIEELPPWGWDMTGEWTITAPELAEDLELDDVTALTMTVKVSNNPLHTRVRRQLYASFHWGDTFYGIMRFAPNEKLVGSGYDTLKEFENACVLEEGCWPGASPQGETKWFMRYRGRYRGCWGAKEGCDQYQTTFSFEKGQDGKLRMEGVIFYEFQPRSFEAVKTRDAPPPPKRNYEGTVVTGWGDLKTESQKNPNRSQRYIVSA